MDVTDDVEIAAHVETASPSSMRMTIGLKMSIPLGRDRPWISPSVTLSGEFSKVGFDSAKAAKQLIAQAKPAFARVLHAHGNAIDLTAGPDVVDGLENLVKEWWKQND